VDLSSLYARTLSSSRAKARTDFLEKVKKLRERLKELFSPESAASFGREAGTFLDAGALAQAFQTRASAQTHPERRARVEGLIATLDGALREAAEQPPFCVFDFADATPEKDVLSVAFEFSSRQLARFTVLLRALRAARLEIACAFDPEIHDEILDRFDWRMADTDELAALPAIVVMETAERLAAAPVASLARLLNSGHPVQIVIVAGGLDGSAPDFGYLAVAHREAFVLQSSVAKPDHLARGLAEMTGKLRPAVAIVSVIETPVLHLSRAFPLFRYDPDRGETWAERFELVAEPAYGVTAAHAVALSDEFRKHFRIIPDSAWSDEQMELQTYLAAFQQQPPLAIPYLWVIDEQGIPQRAIFTRELVNLTRDRQRAWRVFEELGGVKNAYVESAVAQAREEARETATRDGARDAIHRVVAMLTGAPVAMSSVEVEACSGGCNGCRAC
jgi:pyruvate-ferredoxin/flavodoxin oxidoreductase